MRESLCRALLAIAAPSAREWIAAMFSEAREAGRRDRFSWYAGAVRIALASRIRHWAPLLRATVLAALMLTIDWTSGAFLPALVLIGVSAGVLARGSMRRSGVALVVAAGTLPIAHAIANWIPALRPHYQYVSLDLRDWMVLVTVFGIGICAVRVSAECRSIWGSARADC